jgi:putative DNA primase/helicase
VIEQPRRSLLCGTTNESEVLRHASGLRRYWIVEVTKADVALMRSVRDQLIAEAAFYQAQGETNYLPNELIPHQRADAREHRTEDVWLPIVAEWIDSKTSFLQDEGFTARDVLEYALGIPKKDMQRGVEMRAVQLLKDLGFTRKSHTEYGNRWRRPK